MTTDTAPAKTQTEAKLDQVIRILERLEDRVSAIETALLETMHEKQG